MREKLFKIIDVSTEDNSLSHGYDSFMMIVIIVSLVPLAFKTTNTVFLIIEYVSTFVFIIDYLLRLITADFKTGLKHPAAAIVYPFTPMAAIDLLVILSSFSFLSSGFRVLKVLRLLRTLRVLRAAKMLRYSKSLLIIINVFKKEKHALSAVATMAIAYIVVSALVIFNVEPDSFETFFDAIYWATVSLTTVGYGDIYPVSTIGRIVTMISSVFGIAIIALPSGIITGGYLNEINKKDD
ncbi:potassium channel family protein [Ruminococcus flavefaciens]|uniref:Voltage-gated potassium channel n=1 Tax=Ruminococcus flavefaciens TaxID=1265 RepID=A0A315Y483_RUMFL|nr:potassium channel family protein [Ruminococcus flavefaciens]PWJ15481.1 voltage-gated potassium channel [Ruminococcus flavefaciens]SSA40673.1 voltage-gated potassium channel [Ruminococcus flavefaciens]HOO06989.1 ion transporter [Ruminococcus sp.]